MRQHQQTGWTRGRPGDVIKEKKENITAATSPYWGAKPLGWSPWILSPREVLRTLSILQNMVSIGYGISRRQVSGNSPLQMKTSTVHIALHSAIITLWLVNICRRRSKFRNLTALNSLLRIKKTLHSPRISDKLCATTAENSSWNQSTAVECDFVFSNNKIAPPPAAKFLYSYFTLTRNHIVWPQAMEQPRSQFCDCIMFLDFCSRKHENTLHRLVRDLLHWRMVQLLKSFSARSYRQVKMAGCFHSLLHKRTFSVEIAESQSTLLRV